MEDSFDAQEESIGNERVQVGDVYVRGNQKTLSAFILNEVNLTKANTLDDILEACDYAYEELKDFGIFDRIDFALVKGSRPGTCEISIEVAEKQPIQVSAGTEFDSSETSLKLDLLYRNLFGQAEQAKISAIFGTSKSGGFDISYSKPRLAGTRASLDSCFFMNEINRSTYSSFILDTQGFSISVLSPFRTTSIGYTCAKRDIMVAGQSSRSIARAARTSVKSAITATFRLDGRDSPSLPTRGSLFSAAGEIGLPFAGDSTFVKLSNDLQHYIPFGKHVTFGMSLKSGILIPYQCGPVSKGRASTPLPDRFTYGGPLLLRGYLYDSIGPHDGNDMLGGDALLAGAINLTFGFPGTILQRFGIRGHAFVNAGSLISLTDGGKPKYHFEKLRFDARKTAGFGFVIPTSIGRVEANYCWHLNRRDWDRTQSFQLGISTSFL